MTDLARQVANNVAANRGKSDAETQVREAIKARLPTIRALLPEVLDERKLAALVLTEVYKTPKLAACSEESLIGCVLRAAALGLQFGQDLGQAYLIPRGRDCTLQLGYRGVIALAQRSGAIRSITTRSVYKGDTFAYGYGLNEHLDHEPTMADDRTADQITHAYAVVHYTNGGTDFEVLDRAQIEARRRRGGDGPAWKTDYAKMAEKSAILAMRARLPLTTEVATALANDGAALTPSTSGPPRLEATFDEPRQIEPTTGEVTPADVRTDSPPPERTHTAADPIGANAGKTVHVDLARAGIPQALHAAVIARASKGRTVHASELNPSEAAGATGVFARDAAAEPLGFAEKALSAWTADTPERAALAKWMDDQAAEPS